MPNLAAITGTNRDAAGDMLAAGMAPAQVATWLRTRAPGPEVDAFLAGAGETGGRGLDALTQLPDSAGAMERMRGLQTRGAGGLEALLDVDQEGRRKSIEDALYDEQAEDINYAIDRDTQRGLETMFGRNMGTSSVTGDYVLAPLARERASRLASARRNAFTQAGSEVRSDLASQMQLLGQAFNSGTTGLQAEQNVNQANANRQTQVSEAALNRGQQESQFGRSLSQQRELQEKAFENTRDIAGSSAIGAGIGGLAQLFAPAGNRFLANTWPGLFS